MSLSHSVIKSSLLLLLTQLVNRGIGLVSILILARILTPEDYGIVAIATVMIYLFNEISNAGTKEYIIHKTSLDDDILNTAWTLNLIIKFSAWACFLLSINTIADFYEKQELNQVLLVLSLILPLSALQNVGAIINLKELNYKPQFYLNVTHKISAFFVTVAIALWLKNYWALVIGTITSYIVLLFGSYVIHDFRPKPKLHNLRHQWEFSKWMLPKGFFGFSRAEFDTFIVAKLFNIEVLGGFNLMKSISGMVGRDVIIPATEPLLSSFSKIKSDEKKLKFQLTFSLFVILSISLPCVGFISIFHHEIVLLLLGEQWIEYSRTLAALSLLILSFSLSAIFQHLLTSLGHVKAQFIYELFGLFFTVLILLSIDFNNIFDFSLARSLITLLLTAVIFIYVKRVLHLSFISFVKLQLPAILSLCIAGYISINIQISTTIPTILFLLIHGLLFSVIYCSSLIALLFFYRHSEEVIYLRWLLSQYTTKIQNRFFMRNN